MAMYTHGKGDAKGRDRRQC